MSAISVFNRSIQRLQKSQQDIAKTQLAREKNEREKKLLDLKRKKAEADMETSVIEGGMTKIDAELQKEQFNKFVKSQEDILKGQQAQINLAEKNASMNVEDSMKQAKRAFKENPYEIQQSYGFDLKNIGGHAYPVQKTTDQVKRKDVVDLARKLTSDETNVLDDSQAPFKERLQSNISVARDLLQNKQGSMQSTSKPKADKLNVGQVKADKWNVGQIKNFGSKGDWEYAGDNQWKRVK